LRRCIQERLVGGEGFAVDASLIKADANRQKGIEGDKGLPPEATGRAIDEYLSVLDDAAFGAATEVTPKFVSPSDPAARWTGAHGGQAFFAYSTNYLIDTENAIIVDVEATTAIRQAEVLAAKRMIERAKDRFDLRPKRLLGDSAYGSAEMLGWLVEQNGIEPHVSVIEKSARSDGTFSRDEFTYDAKDDIYICPGGKPLSTTGTLARGLSQIGAPHRNVPNSPAGPFSTKSANTRQANGRVRKPGGASNAFAAGKQRLISASPARPCGRAHTRMRETQLTK
jgi:hypothetical protein